MPLLAVAHELERFRLRGLVGALIAFAGLTFLVADRIEANVPLLSLLGVVGGAVFLARAPTGSICSTHLRRHSGASNGFAK